MTAAVLAQPLTPEWHEARRQGIGASEIAAVMGISPWESPFGLYWRKLNDWRVEETPEMRAGRRLEDAIASWWVDECDPNENLSVYPAPLYAHPQRPWQLATPDRVIFLSADWGMVISNPALAVLECKYIAHSWDGWGDPGTDEIPVHYRAQVLWQCDVVDVDTWYLAALGPGGFREYHGRRDERDMAVMREHGRRFMDRLPAGNPPGIDEHSATLATLRRLHPDLDDEPAEVSADVAAGYRRACAMERKAKAVKRRYEARLRDAMGRARKATSDGAFVASRSIYPVAEHTVAAHTVDRLNPPRERKHTP